MFFDAMNKTNRFWEFVLFTLLATLVIIGSILFFLWQALSEEQLVSLSTMGTDYFLYIISIVFICAAVVFTGLSIIFHTYIKPLKKISAEASMIYTSNPSHRLSLTGNMDIKNLSSVINDFADIFEDLDKNITEQILVARKETEKERNLMAAIMAELPQGVIICNTSGRILLFNSLAKRIFTQETHSKRAEYFIGLGRSIFHLIDKDLIVHAIKEIEERLQNDKISVASYFITPIYTGRLVSVETIPVLDQEKQMTGFILTFQDVSDDIDRYENIEQTLFSFNKNLDDTIAHSKIFVEDLIEQTRNEREMASLYKNTLSKELTCLEDKSIQLSKFILDTTLNKQPLSKLPLNYFLSSIQKRVKEENGIQINLLNDNNNRRILADTYSFTVAFIFLIVNLSELTSKTTFTLEITSSNGEILFDIKWAENPTSQIQIENMLTKKIRALPSFGYVLKQNRADFKIIADDNQTCSQVRITSKAESKSLVTKKKRPAVIAASRPEFYDFDLFGIKDENLDLMDVNLKKITYTVFDTETTGLNPVGGDEIISIGAVRIVNSRIVYQDIFEELVDPKRDIPMESYKIHGLSYEMLKGKPDIENILPIFKNYTYDTVLMGHNIAFDMKMLKVKEKTTDVKFSNPVLDTLLLSACLHPVHEQHDMENIAKRLGVNIIGRHTALGDAIATAEIYLKLLPILNSNGIFTLKDAIAASQKTYYARLKY
ncbi:MAG: PAS domain-containing protein [Desulfobacteraceae bacterium]|nr:PAS domain-containing protein [Desulfobacteraceae bacterium]